MRSRDGLKIVFLIGAGTALFFGLGRAEPPVRRWGGDGHRIASRAALGILPEEMPAFFLEAGPRLEYLSPEPDRWYDRDMAGMDGAWRYDHYIDLERVPPGAMDATDRFEFLIALWESGIERPHEDVGFLPFRILEMYQRLATGFAHWRLSGSGAERGWIEGRILNDAGLISHYVVDTAQPHHTTIHFNGWAEGAPNPNEYTMDREFHSRFESAFVRSHIGFEDLPPRMPRRPRTLGDVRSAIWGFLQSSNDTVERMYSLEQEHGFDPDTPPHPEAREFVLERLTEGARMLASIWWTAWMDSQAMADSLRERRGGRRP